MDVPSWPIGSSIVVKFTYDGDESDYIPRAALIAVSPELKERIEAAAKVLSLNQSLRTIQFYWPIDVVTNSIYGMPIPKQFSRTILELLDSDFDQAIAGENACQAIRRVASLDAITWISVERPPFFTWGGTVEIGCTVEKFLDFKTGANSLKTDTQVPTCPEDGNDPQQIIRAIEDLAEWTAQVAVNKE